MSSALDFTGLFCIWLVVGGGVGLGLRFLLFYKASHHPTSQGELESQIYQEGWLRTTSSFFGRKMLNAKTDIQLTTQSGAALQSQRDCNIDFLKE